ncbi:hypothetical protein [Ethanoligenens sp.]
MYFKMIPNGDGTFTIGTGCSNATSNLDVQNNTISTPVIEQRKSDSTT